MNFTLRQRLHARSSAHLVWIVASLWLIGCSSGGGGGGGGGSEEITVASVEQDVRDSFPTGLIITKTSLVADDGYQGTNYDIGRVIISRFYSDDIGSIETLGIAMSYKMSGTPPDGTVVAFYIDTDNDSGTGVPINGIGADALFINDFAFEATNTTYLPYADYYEMPPGTSTWLPYDGTLTAGATYEGFSINSSFFVSNSSKAPDLIGLTNIKGVMTIQRIPSGDPNMAVTTLGSSAAFTFDMP